MFASSRFLKGEGYSALNKGGKWPIIEGMKVCTHTFKTPLGDMIAIGDDEALYLLEFIDRKKLNPGIERLKKNLGCSLVVGKSLSLLSIVEEMGLYFEGQLKSFKTPLKVFGTPFQQAVWDTLTKIPYGKIWSYKELAVHIGKPTAFRAVAMANSCNQLAIIIACHRVINSNGALGGYAGGISKKEYLLKLENSSSDDRMNV